MKNNNTTGTNGAKITLKGNSVFYEPNMKQVQTDVSKSISDRLDKMESMLLYSIDKMDEIDRKLDGFMDNINIRTVGQVYKSKDDMWYDELTKQTELKRKYHNV
jgi:hypothetical protein